MIKLNFSERLPKLGRLLSCVSSVVKRRLQPQLARGGSSNDAFLKHRPVTWLSQASAKPTRTLPRHASVVIQRRAQSSAHTGRPALQSVAHTEDSVDNLAPICLSYREHCYGLMNRTKTGTLLCMNVRRSASRMFEKGRCASQASTRQIVFGLSECY